MTRLLVRIGLLASFVLALAGCFKESGGGGSDSGTETSTTTDTGSCPDGSEGCACYGNGTCDTPLECDGGVCVPPGCEAGAEGCPCAPGGLCFNPLECDETNKCVPPSGTTTSTTNGSSTDATSTTGSVCDPDSMSTCTACLSSNCCDEVEACATVQGCWCMVECLAMGNPVGMCDDACEATNEFIEVATCMFDSCEGECPNLFSCNTGGAEPPCRACAKNNCCAEYRACVIDPQCRCYESCLGSMMSLVECQDQCGDIQGDGPALYLMMAQCVNTAGCMDPNAMPCYPPPP